MTISYSILIIIFLLNSTKQIQFSSSIKQKTTRCFFQLLSTDQKYRIDIYPSTGSLYSFQIYSLNKQQQTWQSEYTRSNIPITQQLNVHKLATKTSTYKFCLTNNDNNNKLFNYSITIQSGLQLLQLHLLPNNTDIQNMALEMQWIKQQTINLKQKINKINSMKSRVQIINGLLQNKIMIWVIIFSGIVIVLNGLFYMRVKKAFHTRKMI